MRKLIRLALLSMEGMWHLETEWDWSYEIDGWRKPRQFFRHRFYKEYLITSVFVDEPCSKSEAVRQFVADYRGDRLLMGETCLVFTEPKQKQL